MRWVKTVCRAVTECVAIVALTMIVLEALKHGINHAIIAIVSVVIGGIAGFELKELAKKVGL